MSVSKDEVLRIAALARLAMDRDAAERFAAQLSRILEHVDALRDAERTGAAGALDTGVVHGDFEAAPLRDDSPATDPLLVPPAAFAPDWADRFFVVPRLAALDADAADAAEDAAGPAGAEPGE